MNARYITNYIQISIKEINKQLDNHENDYKTKY